MLGSDPVLQYDYGLDAASGAAASQGVITLEPVYTGSDGGGGVKEWVDWFFDEAMTGACLTFNYAQAGQENSFGWPGMKAGLSYQVERLAEMARSGRVKIETLAESGEWFRKKYAVTPNSAVTALSDWKNEGKRSIWFCSKNYRVNYYSEGETFWIRDLMLFDDGYTERYLTDTCKNEFMVYDTLPVVDGNRWSGGGTRAGWYFRRGNGALAVTDCAVEESGEDLRLVLKTADGRITITNRTGSIEITSEAGVDPRIEMVWAVSAEMDGARIAPGKLALRHEGFTYGVELAAGAFSGREILPEQGRVEIVMMR
jgi:hypothetical protein